MTPSLSRRALLSGGALLGAGWIAACTTPPSTTPTTSTPPTGPESSSMPAQTSSSASASSSESNGTVLLAYFSRAGENYYNGGRRNLDVGNTEVLAQMIEELTDGPDQIELHKIEPADPYPDSYDATVARNVTEQNANARPGIANPLDSIDRYSTVLLASPIWNVRAPMIMSTFTDAYDFTGKTVLPVVTYAVSGLGGVERDYTAACPGAQIGTGLAVRGEQVAQQRGQVQDWLRQVGLITG